MSQWADSDKGNASAGQLGCSQGGRSGLRRVVPRNAAQRLW